MLIGTGNTVLYSSISTDNPLFYLKSFKNCYFSKFGKENIEFIMPDVGCELRAGEQEKGEFPESFSSYDDYFLSVLMGKSILSVNP